MNLVLFSIISLASISLNLGLILAGIHMHDIVVAVYVLFLGAVICRHSRRIPDQRRVLHLMYIGLFLTGILMIVRFLLPDLLLQSYHAQYLVLPCIIINVLFGLAFYSYYKHTLPRMNSMRVRGNVIFGEIIMVISFIQVFYNWHLTLVWNIRDLLVFAILAISTLFISTHVFSLIISTKFSNIRKNSLLFIVGFFVFALSDMVFVFNFNLLFEEHLPYFYANMKLISYALVGFAVLRAARDDTPLSFVLRDAQGIVPAFNIVWVVIIIPITLVSEGLISMMDFTIQLIIIMGYQFVDYNYNKANDVHVLREREADNLQKLQTKLDERVEKLTLANEQLDISVNRDALTGLKNRYFLNAKMQQLVEHPPETFTFMYLDLDNFKVINDIQGHNIGDIVLIKVAERMMTFDGEGIDICRIGGDEFILMTKEANAAALAALANDITEAIIVPIVIDDMEFCVGASIGIASVPSSVKRIKDLMRSAEIAMYIAKQSDEENCTVFYQSSRSESIKRGNILSLSLNSNKLFRELKLIYQPIVDIKQHKILAVEVSILWHHSELGTIGTDEFLQVVDQTDKTKKIMKWFIQRSIQEVARWQVKYERPLKVHLKLSVPMLSIVKLTNMIEETLKDNHLRPEDLCIDIKESDLIHSFAILKDTLEDLKAIGVTIAVSEFGGGKTAFHILRQIDFDYIKFAPTFVNTLNDNDRDTAILEAMIELSENLDRMPIVPFIEHKSQLAIIEKLGVTLASGDYLMHALPSRDFEELYLNVYRV